MSDFFNIGGYGTYIWSSYALTAVVLIGFVVASLRSLRAREAQLSALEEDQKGDAS